MDRMSREQRAKTMRAIRSKDSLIERRLRRLLWKKGLRYRKHLASVPGTPDIAFPKARIAVFCDSEFWHGFEWNSSKHAFKSNRAFWLNKIEANIARDKTVTRALEDEGWVVMRFWGRQIMKDGENCAQAVEEAVRRRLKIRLNPRCQDC